MISYVKPYRLHARRWLVALSLGCLALTVQAQTEIPFSGPSRNTIEYKASGNTFTWTPVTGDTPRSSQPYRADLSSGTASTVTPRAKWTPELPYANKGGATARATINWPVNPGNVAGGASKSAGAALSRLANGNAYVAFGSLACAFVCQPLFEMLIDKGATGLKLAPDGTPLVSVPSSDAERSDGFYWSGLDERPYRSPSAACRSRYTDPQYSHKSITPFPNYVGTRFWCIATYAPAPNENIQYTTTDRMHSSDCIAGSYVTSDNRCISTPPMIDTPLTGYLNSNYTGKGWDKYWAGLTAGLIAAGHNVFTDGTGTTITGPATVPVSVTTTTTPVNVVPGTTTPVTPGTTGPSDSGTSLTTTTTTAGNTYRSGNSSGGPSVTTTTTSTTTTKITNNVTNTSSTNTTNLTNTDNPPEEKKEDDFCKKNPDSLACATGDIPDGDVPKSTIAITYEYADIFGNGSCPSDSYMSTHGQTLKVWDWQATCDYVSGYFKFVLLACCSFVAFVIVSAGGKE